jgi:hypothetical protein
MSAAEKEGKFNVRSFPRRKLAPTLSRLSCPQLCTFDGPTENLKMALQIRIRTRFENDGPQPPTEVEVP